MASLPILSGREVVKGFAKDGWQMVRQRGSPRIELLSRAHNRKGFHCGNEPLNSYLRHTARQHTERGISRTFVLISLPDHPLQLFLPLPTIREALGEG